MNNLPKRKPNRLKDFDYSTPGAYFITICTNGREPILWDVGAATCRPNLSKTGTIVKNAIVQISEHYPMFSVDQYCIMPDHIHMILSLNTDKNGRQIAAPTISTVVGHMKRWVSVQIGQSIWQKSFYEHGIRGKADYAEISEYIENNPKKYTLKKACANGIINER